MSSPQRSSEIQRAYFEDADPERFHWTTEGPGFAETEDALLEPFLPQLKEPCLEVGCGEGNNLMRLLRRVGCVGVDLFPRKLAFAVRQLPEARLAAAEAMALPFADGSFATVFIRDLLHHLPDPQAALVEAARVLRPGGLLCLLEPNGRSPLIRLQARLVRAEAGARRFEPKLLEGWLRAAPFRQIELRTAQPFPLRRLVLHYRMGAPALGRSGAVRGAIRLLEAGIGRGLPSSRWTYLAATARRSGP